VSACYLSLPLVLCVVSIFLEWFFVSSVLLLSWNLEVLPNFSAESPKSCVNFQYPSAAIMIKFAMELGSFAHLFSATKCALVLWLLGPKDD
jgi:hypothetical protein